MVTGKLIIQESLSETQCTLAVQKNDDAADRWQMQVEMAAYRMCMLKCVKTKWPNQSTNTSISQTKHLKRLFKYRVNVM